MPRYCFQLQVDPERLTEYVQRHRSVAPEMQDALRATGWRNYSLFLRSDGPRGWTGNRPTGALSRFRPPVVAGSLLSGAR